MMSPLSMIEALKDFVSRVDALGISYMVTGSLAMSVYITARTTMDIDVVIEIRSNEAERFANQFLDGYYVNPNSIRRAIDNQSMFNIVNQVQGVKIDCIPRKDDEFSRERFKRRVMATIDDAKFWAITKEDLILAKLMWASESHSEVQFRDISNLVDSGYDLEYVNHWSDRLKLKDTWKALSEWKTQAAK
jgi:hypothetical protein